jgi:hypothetical protein
VRGEVQAEIRSLNGNKSEQKKEETTVAKGAQILKDSTLWELLKVEHEELCANVSEENQS